MQINRLKKKSKKKISNAVQFYLDVIYFLSINRIIQWIDSFVGARVVNAPLHAELAIDDRVQKRGDKERYRGGLERYDGVRGKDKEEAREPDVSPPPTRKGWETVKKKRKEERGWREERHGELEVATSTMRYHASFGKVRVRKSRRPLKTF